MVNELRELKELELNELEELQPNGPDEKLMTPFFIFFSSLSLQNSNSNRVIVYSHLTSCSK